MEQMWDVLVSHNVKPENQPVVENAVNVSADSGYLSEPEEGSEEFVRQEYQTSGKRNAQVNVSSAELEEKKNETELEAQNKEEEEQLGKTEKGEFFIPPFFIPPFQPVEEPLETSDGLGSYLDIVNDVPNPESEKEYESEKFEARHKSENDDSLELEKQLAGSDKVLSPDVDLHFCDLTSESETESEPDSEVETENGLDAEAKYLGDTDVFIAPVIEVKKTLHSHKETNKNHHPIVLEECEPLDDQSVSNNKYKDVLQTMDDILFSGLFTRNIFNDDDFAGENLNKDEEQEEDQCWENKIGENRRWDPGENSWVSDEYEMKQDSTNRWIPWKKTHDSNYLQSDEDEYSISSNSNLSCEEEEQEEVESKPKEKKTVETVSMSYSEFADLQLKNFRRGACDGENLRKTGHKILGITPEKTYKSKFPLLGLNIVDGEIGGRKSLIVSSVDEDSPFFSAITKGDQVLKVNSKDLRLVNVRKAKKIFKSIKHSKEHAVLFHSIGEEDVVSCPGAGEPKKKPSKIKILHSLAQDVSNRLTRKRRQPRGEEGDGDGGRRDESNNKVSKQDLITPSNFRCDICGLSADAKRFKESEVVVLTEKESVIVLLTRNVIAKILCKDHHENAVKKFLRRSDNKQCCNIYQKHSKAVKTKLLEVEISLSNDAKQFTEKVVVPGQKICKRICLPLLQEEIDAGKIRETYVDTDEDPINDVGNETEEDYKDPGLEPVNKFLDEMDLSPVRCIRSRDDLDDKLSQVDSALRNRLDPGNKFPKENDFLEFLNNLRESHNEMGKEEKAHIIKLLPTSWSSKKISEETGISERFINDARNDRLVFERKVRSDKMSEELKEKIIQFYLSDRISKILPGTNISVKGEDGKRTLMCKQLLFLPVHETYSKYKEKYPEDKVSLHVFRQLRPKNVVLVGAPGTHETCKCISCENPSLLVDSSLIGELETFKELVQPGERVTMRNLIKNLVCEENGDDCNLSSRKHTSFSCEDCEKKQLEFRKVLLKKLEDEEVESIGYIQWDFDDGNQRERRDLKAEDFVDKFLEDANLYKSHQYMTEKQFDSLDDMKHNLGPHEVLMWMDYSENFQPPNQREVQTAHFKNNVQISLLGAYIYYNDGEETKEQGIVIISDDTTHNTTSVFSSYIKLQEWIKEEMDSVVKTTIVSDGCAGQFKNRFQFSNIAFHEEDFGHPGHWIFSTTGHGKCSVDAIFGAVKTAARQECLRRGYRNDITSAQGLYDFIKTHKKSNGKTSDVIPMIIKTEDYEKIKNNRTLQSRWAKTKTIDGTQSNHDYRCDPTDKNFLLVRPYTSCDQFKRVRLTKKNAPF